MYMLICQLINHSLEQDLAPFFQSYGFVSDIRLQSERGFAFIKYGMPFILSAGLINLVLQC